MENDARFERDLLAQAIWDVRSILGQNTDGIMSPSRTLTELGYAEFANEHRRNAMAAVLTLEARLKKVTAERDAALAKIARAELLLDDEARR